MSINIKKHAAGEALSILMAARRKTAAVRECHFRTAAEQEEFSRAVLAEVKRWAEEVAAEVVP